MKTHVIRPTDLSRSELELWTGLQELNGALVSPFFSPWFTLAVAAVRSDAYVAVIEDGQKIVGFFPFQRADGTGIGRPIGGPLSDYQGVVAAPETEFDPTELVRGCGLDAIDFDHLLVSQTPFTPHHRAVAPSLRMELAGGYEAYELARKRAGHKVVNRRSAERWRKLEREIGPLRFETSSPSAADLHKLLQWKSEQYRATRAPDIFSYDWTVRLIENIHSTADADFAGVLSTLRAGDHLIAAHMGMRSRSDWHYWFPAYDPRFSKFSPGMLLLVKMARNAEKIGVKTIDLGKGETGYKRKLGGDAVLVAEGYVAPAHRTAFPRRVRWTFEDWLRRLPPSGASRWTINGLRRCVERGRFS